MFQFLVHISKQDLAIRQLPAFSLSFLLAALFYRFGSFALECLAFLATWFVLDALAQVVVARRPSKPARQHASGG